MCFPICSMRDIPIRFLKYGFVYTYNDVSQTCPTPAIYIPLVLYLLHVPCSGHQDCAAYSLMCHIPTCKLAPDEYDILC